MMGLAVEVYLLVLVYLSPISGMVNEDVTLDPAVHRITTPGGSALFTCYATHRSSDITAAQWTLNGTSMDDFNQSHIVIDLAETPIGNFGHLMLRDIPVGWNNTVIQCTGNFASGTQTPSDTCILRLQGLLAAVGSLSVSQHNSFLTLSWTAPFTFSFGTVLPDITYCVDVINTVALATSQLPAEKIFSRCGVAETEFDYSFVPSTCDHLEFAVTPVNQAGMGSVATVSDVMFDAQWVIVAAHPSMLLAEDVVLTLRGDVSSTYMTFELNTSTVVFQCSVEIWGESGDTHLHLNETSGVQCGRDGRLSWSTALLEENSFFSTAVTTANCMGSVTSHMTMSTYDVQRIHMETCSSPNCIQFSTTYSINSPALGVLLIFLPRGQEQAAHQNPTYVMSSRSVTGTSLDPREVSDMPVGEYQVLAYDVEWNWDISPGGPAARGVVSVINGSSTVDTSSSDEMTSCNITSHDTTVTVTCVHTPPGSGYMSLLQDPNNMEELMLTGQFSGAVSAISFRGVPPGMYVVTVLVYIEATLNSSVVHTEHVQVTMDVAMETSTDEGEVEGTLLPSTSWTMTSIFSVVCYVLGLLTVVVVIVVVCVCRRLKTRDRSVLFRETKIAECPVYEDIGPHLSNRVVYEDVGPKVGKKTCQFELEENEAYGRAVV